MTKYEKEQLIKILKWVYAEQSIAIRESLRKDGIDPDGLGELKKAVDKIKITDK